MTTAVANPPPDIALGNLPEWDLSDLYPAPDSAELEADLEEAARESRIFSDRYKGKLAGLSGDALGAAISEYEVINEIIGRIMSYAQLIFQFPCAIILYADLLSQQPLHQALKLILKHHEQQDVAVQNLNSLFLFVLSFFFC